MTARRLQRTRPHIAAAQERLQGSVTGIAVRQLRDLDELFPITIGGRYCLEIGGDDLRYRDQGVGIFTIDRP